MAQNKLQWFIGTIRDDFNRTRRSMKARRQRQKPAWDRRKKRFMVPLERSTVPVSVWKPFIAGVIFAILALLLSIILSATGIVWWANLATATLCLAAFDLLFVLYRPRYHNVWIWCGLTGFALFYYVLMGLIDLSIRSSP